MQASTAWLMMVMTVSMHVVHDVVTAVSALQVLPLPAPWGQARIDYTFAQEHIDSRHPHLYHYFGKNKRGIVVEDIFNARDGVYVIEEDAKAEPTLENCGFELHVLKKSHRGDEQPAAVSLIDWESPDQMRAFTEDLRRSVIPKSFGGGDDDILYCIFWNAFIRAPEMKSRSSSASLLNSGNDNESDVHVLPRLPPAPTAHIDVDVSELMDDSERLINLLEKNRVVNRAEFDSVKCDMMELVREGHRFVMLNIWRSLGEIPIQRDPLGLLAVRYGSLSTAYPMEELNERHSCWYFYPNMTCDECLLFKQYDRDATLSSDIWHCALSFLNENVKGQSPVLPPRRSIDVRAFVVLKGKVDSKHDRFQSRNA